MNYKESLEYIDSTVWMGSRPGLERIRSLMTLMGDPQKDIKFIHVAGTNGKGSFCAMTASILRTAGYHVGLYVSPYVLHFNERMSIDGVDISDDELAELTTYVRSFADTLDDPPTEFELITAIAFEYFKRNKCDIVVLECGMGGRLDSTNIIGNSVLSVITGIALDHMNFLGDTVPKIAAEKAGIIKPGTPVHWGGKDSSAEAVIAARAAELGSEFHAVDYSKLTNVSSSLDGSVFDFDGECGFEIKLLGLYQPENAASVISAVKVLRRLGFVISDEALRHGLAATEWMARFERLAADPTVIYDGSHNPQGITAAVESIKAIFAGEKVNILTGVMADKDYRFMARKLSEVAAKVFTVTPNNTRSLPAEDYAEVFRSIGVPADSFATLEDGVAAAYASSKESETPLIALGSLYMYADFRSSLEKIK